MVEEDRLVEQLQKELRNEAFSRQLQEELNSKLQDEYDELLKRLAEAELHIDRMRLGANVDFNKYFIIRHHREQHSTLRQRLEAQFDPEWRKPPQERNDVPTKAAVRSTGVGTEASPTAHQDTASFNSDFKHRKRTHENYSSSEEHRNIKSSSSGTQNGEESNNVAASRYVPLSPHIADLSGNSSRELANESSLQLTPNDHSSRSVDTSASALDSSSSAYFNAHHTSNGFRGLKGHRRGHSKSQEMLLQSSNLSSSLTHSQPSFSPQSSIRSSSTQHHASSSSISPHPSSPSPSRDHLSSSHGHTSSPYTSTDDVSFSKMSASTIEIRGSTESLQLAQLFKVHSLQEELERLKLKLNDRNIPLDEIVQDASRIHQEHQQLARDVEALSTNINTLRNKNSGKVTDRIARSKRAIENELASLAEQLQEVYDLLHARSEQEKESNLPPQEAPSSPIQKKDSDSRLSSAFYDSLNSPYLPTKYLSDEASTDNQLQSTQEPPLSNGRISMSPGALHPSLSSTPLESNSAAHLTNGAVDSQQLLSNQKKGILQTGKCSRHSRDGDIDNGGSRSGENTPSDNDSSTPLEHLIELGASGHRVGNKNEGDEPTTLSDLSDEEAEEELNVNVNLPKDTPNGSGRSPSPLDLSRCMTPVPSPDSLHLQEAKRNLKQAEELGYKRSNSHPESHGSSRDDHPSSQSNNNGTTVQSSGGLSHTPNPAVMNRRRNTLPVPPLSSTKPSQIPRLIQSQLSPRPFYSRGPNSSGYHPHHRQTQQNSSNTTVGGASMMNKEDQSGMTYPGEGDSGFAGSELPSRTATRMDTTNPTRSLTSSVLQSTTSEDDANQQRFLEASAAIEALRKELADLKLQMMRNVTKHSDSIPRTLSSNSHSTIIGHPLPTITSSHLNSREYSPSSSQPKLLTREFSRNPSALSLPLQGINTPSSHHTLADGGRSSQMTTTSSTTNMNTPSHHALMDGGRSSQMTTNTNTASSHYALTDGGQSSQMTTTTNTASSHHALTDGGRSSQMATTTNTASSHHALTDGGRSSQMTTTTNTVSSHHALTDGGRSSQMTTTTNTVSSHHALTDGGRSSQITTTTLTTNNIDTNTPSHSSESTTSPAHPTYSRRGSSTTAVTKVGLTPKSSPGNSSGQPSSVCLSTPALSSYASLKSTPIPTPQHSATGYVTSAASFHQPSSIASGRHNVVSCDPSNGYASSSNASDQLISRVPGYDGSASDHYANDRMGYYHSSQPTSVSTAPSTIRRMTTRGGVDQYRPPSYEQARTIPSESNRATANSSFIVPSAISTVPLEPSDTEGRATENGPSLAVSNDNAYRHCGEKTAQVSYKETRPSQQSLTQRRIYAPSYNTNPNPSQEQSQQSHPSTESRGAPWVDMANSLLQSDHEMGHGPGPYHVRSVDASNVMSFNGAQTPMATSTPSRRDAVLNARHVHAQRPYYGRDKLSERFKDSRESSEGENKTAGVRIPASYDTPACRSRPVASNQNTFPRYSSTPTAGRSPQNQRKSSEDFTAHSTHSSPIRSQAQYYCGYSSGVSSSVQSSPGHGYSSTRRASSPALYYTDARRKSYGERIVQERGNGRARHSDNNNMGRYSEGFSGDSDEERNHDRNVYLSSEGRDEAYAARDDRTPHVHVHVPRNARHVSIRRRRPSSHYRDEHYSDSETSPEHQYHGHAKPRVVKVVKTPKRQVVYLASEDTPPEEIYYSESGSGLFTPRQTPHCRKVVGVVESRNGRSLSRGDRGVRVARVRGSRPRKVYVEQPSDPVKRVYIVERESESESDLEQIETIEMREIDLDDTLQLAHELKRRSKRLHGTLKAELERQALH